MKKAFLFFISCFFFISASAQVALKTEGQDPAYVETIKGRAQKIVDALGISDDLRAENVRNIIANRYFLLNDIHTEYDKTVKFAKDSLQGKERDKVRQEAANRRDAELYKHHFELQTALSTYLNEEQIEAVKDGMTYGRVQRDYKAQCEMIPSLTPGERAQVLLWLKEAREFAMDAGDSKQKHAWFDKYRGRTNNWLSARGYDLKKEREEWQKRTEKAKK